MTVSHCLPVSWRHHVIFFPLQAIICFMGWQYTPAYYEDYTYEPVYQGVGWCMVGLALFLILAVGYVQYCKANGCMKVCYILICLPLQWRHNGVANHQPHDCLICLFRLRSKKISRLRVTGLCVGNSPVAGEFPAQMANNAENVSTWWRHHVLGASLLLMGSPWVHSRVACNIIKN